MDSLVIFSIMALSSQGITSSEVGIRDLPDWFLSDSNRCTDAPYVIARLGLAYARDRACPPSTLISSDTGVCSRLRAA
jgi:hypothetical protein